MYKLLPEEEKIKVAHEYSLRRLVVVNLGIVVLLLIGLVGLLPSYLLSSARHSEAEARAVLMRADGPEGEREEVLSWLSLVNRKLALLSSNVVIEQPLELFERFLRNDFEGISVTYLNWNKAGEEITLTVSGLAEDRQKLIRFEEQINASGQFKKASFPISQLAKERNLDFKITLSPLPRGPNTR
jgi:hypothetical protein